jgi:ABC-type phosphate transport system auxiliary subunit
MSTTITHPAYSKIFLGSPRTGITEQKKAELDALVIKVTDAEHQVEQFQAIVDSLTTKSANFQGFLATAEADRTQAYNNKVLVDQVVQSALDLRGNSQTTFDEITKADARTKELAAGIKIVMDRLLYSAQVIDNISNKIIRKKSVNALISDDLISMLATAGKAANDAVALTLTALKATFAAECSNMETEAALALEFKQSAVLYSTLITDPANTDDSKIPPLSIKNSLHKAYTTADTNYKQMDIAYQMTVKQLASATSVLTKAQIKLRSLQQGLAAANAAAMAS